MVEPISVRVRDKVNLDTGAPGSPALEDTIR